MAKIGKWILAGVVILVLAIVLFVWPGLPGSTDDNDVVYVCPDGQQASNLADCNQTAQPAQAPAPTRPQATQATQQGAGTTNAPTQQAKCPGDREVHPGETVQVPPGCNVKGDVSVNGQRLYDDDPTTGLIVSCPNGCTIFAPWGANVTPRGVEDLKAEMLSSGCGSKCTSVKVVIIVDAPPPPSKPPVVITNLCDVSLPKGAKALLPGGCIVSGDVEFASSESGPFKALYDSDQTTGLVVVVKSDTWIRAPFGASVTNASVDDVVNAVKQTGCGLPNGCRVVNVVTVP